MKVIIMRGLPGSGKSYFANRLKLGGRAVVVSADDAHTVDGVYRFDPAKKAQAHDNCLRQALEEMKGDYQGFHDTNCALLIVDNTNIAVWEIAPYYRLAEVFDLQVEVVRLHCDFETACRQNVHEVPRSVIWAMYQMLMAEKLPPWWKETILLPCDDGDTTVMELLK